MLSTSQKTRLFLNYIHKQMYSSSQSFERIIHNHFSDCQIEKAGGVRWCSGALRTLGRIEWNIIANDSVFFLFFTNQIALIIKWLHHSTELLQMLTRKWQLSEFPTISIWRCWLQFLFTLIHFKMRVLLCSLFACFLLFDSRN